MIRAEDPDAGARLAADVAARFGDLPTVVAVALGGSRAAGLASPGSDVDLYVYADPEPALPRRAAIAGATARRELNQRFWEPGDIWIDAGTGLQVDVMYRSPGWIEQELSRVLNRHEASVGYSTAIWHNVRTSEPLVDPSGWFAALQERAHCPYPEALRRSVVAKNRPLLRRSLTSFLRQIDDAVRRGDGVAVQHRVGAFLASFFDVLFALNRQTHPGEKRLAQYAVRDCPRRPDRFTERIDDVLAAAAPPPDAATLLRTANTLVDDLDRLLREDGLIDDDIQAEGPAPAS